MATKKAAKSSAKKSAKSRGKEILGQKADSKKSCGQETCGQEIAATKSSTPSKSTRPSTTPPSKRWSGKVKTDSTKPAPGLFNKKRQSHRRRSREEKRLPQRPGPGRSHVELLREPRRQEPQHRTQGRSRARQDHPSQEGGRVQRKLSLTAIRSPTNARSSRRKSSRHHRCLVRHW